MVDKTLKYRKFIIQKCSKSNCKKTVKIRSDNKIHSGKCKSCSKLGLPYMTQYKNLFHDWRKTKVEITYEQYLEFTKIKYCHYCYKNIPWQEHRKNNKTQQAYFLDRKDNNGSYSFNNCVVCCTRCNRMRSNKFTYEEFVLFSPILKLIEKNRGIS